MPVLGLKSKPMAKKSNMLSEEVEIIVMDYSVNLELYGIRVKKRYLDPMASEENALSSRPVMHCHI